MSKPLKLTVYPHWTDEMSGRCYADREGLTFPINVDYWIQCKRLTDAELAAEYYSQDSRCRHEQWIEAVRGDEDYTDAERAGASRMYEQLTMLHRFASLPHHDEDQL